MLCMNTFKCAHPLMFVCSKVKQLEEQLHEITSSLKTLEINEVQVNSKYMHI